MRSLPSSMLHGEIAAASARLAERRARANEATVESALDRLARMVAEDLDVPAVFVAEAPGGAAGRITLAGGFGLPSAWSHLDEAPFARSLSRDVLREGAPVLVSAADEGDGRPDPSIRAFLGVPAPGEGGEPVGLLVALDRRGRRWSEAATERLSVYAELVGRELSAAALVEEAKRLRLRAARADEAARRDRALRREIAAAFSDPSISCAQRFERLLEAGRHALDLEFGSICRCVAGDARPLYVHQADGFDAETSGAPGDRLRSFVVSGSEVVAFHDEASARKALKGGFACAPKGRYLAAPLATATGVIGLLEFWSPEPRGYDWTEGEIAIVSLLGLFVAAHLGRAPSPKAGATPDSLLIDHLLRGRAVLAEGG